MDSVDNLPYCYSQVIHKEIVKNYSSDPTYPHLHRYYYYDGYLFIYFQRIIKTK